MTITRHGVLRFKQRQKIKNNEEMRRKVDCAIKRGKLLKNASTSPDISCYLFDGYCYVIANNNERLVTVFRPYKTNRMNKKALLESILKKEFKNELKGLDLAH